MLAQTYALSQYETLVELQYRNSDPVQAKADLLDLLNFMHLLQERQKIIAQRAFDNDEAVAFLRLALLEEKSGSPENAQAYIQKARETFNRAYHKQYSEEYLRTFIEKVDAQPEL